ncbi:MULTISPECIES: nuclear transport factor 2 family protein [unclassified Beijerinckia]|uniref:YybH family protein n=1 Tax=unclassified Beijerinckia TaxID=2638183 RepID=UPI00089AF0D8|nr:MULTISPECIES: nuclear transport factor 2 family protein [unclassified Beijerinckia]MDH7796182.1 ketosteroid isomerase-like protein [Beijerinckia sp. GAS462]SEC33890.1 Ketosteroid isomerase homolog [Beijerinckia sp. 28-YEA-48]
MPVTQPDQMNTTFARAFNSRKIGNLLVLYEPDATLRVDDIASDITGLEAISHALRQLLGLPGTMTSRNRFCVVHGDLALLRADWDLTDGDGTVLASGSSAELIRRQPDGTWLYVVDHAVGASLSRAE